MGKTKMKRASFFLTVLFVCYILCGVLTACVPSGATYVRLSETAATLYVGEELTLTVETDGSDEEIVWSSDATHVVTVDGGTVTAVAAGEATVKARVGKVRAYCEITVLPLEEEKPTVKEGNFCELYGDYFVIGAAVQTTGLKKGSYGDLMKHFNSITPENNMKWKNVEKTKGVYTFDQSGDSADQLVAWAKESGTKVRGHCLLWYKSLPTWLHDEFDGEPYSESLKSKAFAYIDERVETMMKHFGNDVYVWDVCNEALFNSVDRDALTTSAQYPYGKIWRTDDNMSANTSDWVDWYKVCGGYEYIAETFKKADEVRREYGYDTELYYNDYALNNPYKRQACLNLVQMLRDHDAPIDGIGMQAHYKLDNYTEDRALWLKNFEDSVKAFLNAGLDVQITELDIRFEGELTAQREQDQAEMYGEIFKICRKYAKTGTTAHGITGVTFWGVQDGSNGAWGENTYPLVFGTDREPKQAYYEIINF